MSAQASAAQLGPGWASEPGLASGSELARAEQESVSAQASAAQLVPDWALE